MRYFGRSVWVLFIVIGSLFVGCAGMPEIFKPAEPYCNEEERSQSVIYKYMNPADTDFVLLLGTAGLLDKKPDMAPQLKEKLEGVNSVLCHTYKYPQTLQYLIDSKIIPSKCNYLYYKLSKKGKSIAELFLIKCFYKVKEWVIRQKKGNNLSFLLENLKVVGIYTKPNWKYILRHKKKIE